MNYEIDLTIEAVTGTVYDLCVSPFETILGIKTKIQKLEGIPVSQQHLIYGSSELMDEFCLEEYHIQSGAQLKLVIAMRGGPIHAHRIQLEDFALIELAEYLESQSPDEQDQYAVMLLSNFSRSEDNDARSQLHSPIEISDSCLRGSQTSLLATTKPTKVLSNFENDVTCGKMRDIQSKLKNLRLNRAEHMVLSKPGQKDHRNPDLLPVLQERSPSNFSRLSSCTPPSSICTCGCYKKHCHCPCHNAQRCLRFAPIKSEDKTSHINSPGDMKLWERHPSARVSYEKRRRADVHVLCAYTTPCKECIFKNSSRLKSFNSMEFQSLRDDDKSQSKSSHFLPPINSKPSCKPQPKKEPDCFEPLPPIVVPKPLQKPQYSNRCMQCHKRMRLANSFTCRCGGTYCSSHRYAESHSCTFNYKADGKQSIARNNPLVTAPKLSKI